MKKVTGLVILLAVLLLGSYYATGVITERTVKNNLSVVNHSNGLYAEVVSYKRGWFQSQALLDWSVHVPAREVTNANGQVEKIPAQSYQIEMPLVIYHGPIVFSNVGVMFGLGYAHTDLSLPSKVAEQFDAYFTKDSKKPAMAISLFVNYLNDTQVNINIPQFNLAAKQGKMEFNWQGMSSKVKTTASLSKIGGSFEVQGFGYLQNQVQLTVGDISGTYNLHKTDSGLFYGDATTQVPSVVINNLNDKIFELKWFSVDTKTDIEANLFNSYLSSSLKEVFFNGRVFGPAQFDIAIKNLDAQVLAQINDVITKAQQGTDADKQQAILSILPQLPRLFAQGAVVDMSKLSLVVPEGEVDADFNIALPKGPFANPFELIQKITGKGTLKLPAALLKGMMAHSVKQKLMSQVSNKADVSAASSNGVAVAGSSAAVASSNNADSATKSESNGTNVISLDDIEKQVGSETDSEIAHMLQSGLLVQQGTDYVLTVQLIQGQFVVNNKPFTPAMLKV